MHHPKLHFLKMALVPLILVPLVSGIVMLLWNWLMPSLFVGVQQIDYLRAVGLLVLCRILFGGLRGRGWHHAHHRQRWEQMTDEEREKFKHGMRMFRHAREEQK